MAEILCWLQLVTVLTAFIGLVVVYSQKASEIQKIMLAVMVCVFTYNFGYFLEINSHNLDEALMAVRIEYAGLSYMAVLYLLCLCAYLKIEVKRWIKIFLFFHGTLVFATVVMAKYTNLYYSSIMFSYEGLFPHLILKRGILYISNMIITLTLLAASFFVVFKKLRETETKHKRVGISAFLVAAIFPFIAYLVTVLRVFGEYDMLPIGMLVALVIFLTVIMKERVFNIEEIVYEKIVRDMQESVIIADTELNILNMNTAAEKVLRELDSETVKQTLKNMCFGENEEYNISSKYYIRRVSEIEEAGKIRAYIIVLVDVTGNREDLDKLEALKNRADSANRAKSIFLTNMSHEIRTPLTGIMGYCDLILKENLSDDVRKMAKGISTSSRNLLSILNNLIDISKIEKGQIEMHETQYFTQSLIFDIISIITILADNEKIQLNTNISPDIPYRLNGDPSKIRQTVVSLSGLLMKSSTEGISRLDVKWEYSDENTGTFIFGVGVNSQNVRNLEIAGKLDQLLKEADENDQTLDAETMGLVITKAYVKVLGADIDIVKSSMENYAITISVKQTVADKRVIGDMDCVPDVDEDLQDVEISAPKANILVVDDNQINLDVMDNYLKHYGIHADLADGGKKAIELCKNKKYDIIFMDQMMPEMDGVEAASIIRKNEKGSQPVIVAFTANTISGVKESLLELGFNDFMKKPIKISYLEGVLVKYLPKDKIVYKKKEATTDTKKISIEIKGIDTAKGIEYCDNDYEQYINELVITEKYGGGKLMELSKAYEEKDIETFTIIAHSMKSTAYMLGAVTTGDLAKSLEMAGKSNDLDYINENAGVLISEYEELLENIKQYLNEYMQSGSSESEEDKMADNIIGLIKEKNYEDALSLMEILISAGEGSVNL